MKLSLYCSLKYPEGLEMKEDIPFPITYGREEESLRKCMSSNTNRENELQRRESQGGSQVQRVQGKILYKFVARFFF